MKIEKWEVNEEHYNAYLTHLQNRLNFKDTRPVEERERERSEFHDRLLDAVKIEEREDFRGALEQRIEEKLGGGFSYTIGLMDVGVSFGGLIDQTVCPLCDNPAHGTTPCPLRKSK